MESQSALLPIWEYFKRINKTSAVCNQCGVILKVDGGTTSGMHAHLKIHGLAALKRKSNASTSTSKVDSELKVVVQTEKTVWAYFQRLDKSYARCNQCAVLLKTCGGCTSGLHSHLQMKHQIAALKRKSQIYDPNRESTSQSHPSAATTKTDADLFVSDDPLNDEAERDGEEPTMDLLLQFTIARLVAKDALPFRVLLTSLDLRSLLKNEFNRPIPTCGNTIQQMVIEYGAHVQSQLKAIIAEVKNAGQRFSVSLEEWRSQRNRRYMNVKLHFYRENRAQTMHLGVFRLHAEMPGVQCAAKLNEKLADFELSMEEDVVCCTTDRSNVMVELARKLPTLHVLCLMQTLQLTVAHVLYNIAQNSFGAVLKDEETSEDDSDDDTDGLEVVNEFSTVTRLNNLMYQQIVQKVRNAVLFLKRSGVHVGDGVILKADCKTRWSSLADMIATFLQWHKEVQQLLIELGSHIQFSHDDLRQLRTIIETLNPIKNAMEMLQGDQRSVTLVSAEGTVNLLLERLREANSDLGNRMANALNRRIAEYRSGVYSIQKYLHSGNDDSNSEADLAQQPSGTTSGNAFSTARREDVAEMVGKIVERLYRTAGNEDDHFAVIVKSEPGCDPIIEMHQKKLFQNGIAFSYKRSASARARVVHDAIDKELVLFELSGNRGKYLQLVYDALHTIPANSINGQRAFSADVKMSSRLRSRLNDETIDTILMLRGYFMNMEK